MPQRINPLYVVGAALTLSLYVAFAWLREAGQGHDTAYLAGVVTGALVLALVVVLIVFAIARRGGRTVTPAARARMVFWTGLVLFVVECGGFATDAGTRMQQRASTVVSDSERTGLVLEADSIRHPHFGFVLPHPGSAFDPDSGAQHRLDSALANHPQMVAWVLTAPQLGESVIIEIFKFRFVNERQFREFVAGVRRTALPQASGRVLQDTLTWSGERGEFLLGVEEPNGVMLAMRCLPHTAAPGAIIACVSTTGPEPDQLAFVRTGLTFPAP